MSKVHHFYLRRYVKGNGNHPFCTVGVAVNEKTYNLHIGTLTLHSSDTHFVKSRARFLLPRKVFGSGSVVRTGDIHFDIGSDMRLEDYISDYVAHHILDRDKAQEMFVGVVRDAVTEYRAQFASMVRPMTWENKANKVDTFIERLDAIGQECSEAP
jgi:hypothetical protein